MKQCFDNDNDDDDNNDNDDDLLPVLPPGSPPPLPYPHFSEAPTISNVDSNMESENDWRMKQQPMRRAAAEAEKIVVAVQNPKYLQPPLAVNEEIVFCKI